MRPDLKTLRCFALLTLLGWAGAGALAASPGHAMDTRAYNLAHGRVVFSEHCLRCHENGRLDAPTIGDPEGWSVRLDQPLDELIAHAVGGHGNMPARGETALSDQEVASAVAYFVSRARLLLAARITALPAPDPGVAEPMEAEPIDKAALQMFLLWMSKDRWK